MSLLRRDFLRGSGAALGVGVLAACSADDSSNDDPAAPDGRAVADSGGSGGSGEVALGSPDEVRGVLPASTLLALADGRVLRHGVSRDVVELVERGAVIWHVGGDGTEPGQFRRIASAAAGPDGSFWIVDAGNRRVQVLSADGRAIQVIGAPSDDSTPLRRPVAVAVAPDGRSYVGDASRSGVVPFAADGTPGELIGGHDSDHPLVGIAAVEIAAGELVVVESLAPRAQVRDLDGRWLRSIELPPHFATVDLAVDGDQVYLISSDGQLVRTTIDGATGADRVERLGHIGSHARGVHLTPVGVVVAARPLPIDLIQ
jgi:hypothetical protein